MWRAFAAYFPARLVKTADLDPAGHYLLVAHPHGILALSSWLSFATDATGFSAAFPGVDLRVATLESNFRVPLLREYCLLHGLCGAGRAELNTILSGKPGQSVLLVVGGAAEALLASPGSYDLVLNARKGFVRLAMKSGASLVPVIAYGETDTFHTYIPAPSSRAAAVIRSIKRTCGFSTPLCWGTGLFGGEFLAAAVQPYRTLTLAGWGFLPLSTPLTTVIGPPLAVEQVPQPSDAQVDAVHAQYVRSLKQLWADTADKYGKGHRRELAIVL
ncbi:Diacylglycerol O-acyltransferase 2B [Tetrabaena socialis]|uniref:diacylglycerol O-acyltransferase n=1 Tax=Tetrabaena socialis TaxID=47790 RepID=A0A2J8AK93_9CHLO|nr:Diacylglycerol O-acyltransferase 2B [Tetrabaena socialis]|eukprot:PNH12928.1 Diacylglycerol O-acyltransferase 2B [Tetrabaena socialis]